LKNVFHTDRRASWSVAVTINPIRQWRAHAFGRSPLTRGADRVEAWAVIAVFVVLIAAVFPALAVGQLGYQARTQEIAADIASRHPVEATALGASTADPSVSETTPTTFLVNVRWYEQNTAREAVTKVDGPVKAGDQVPLWVTTKGIVTAPPPTAADGIMMKIGTVALSWLILAVLVAGAYGILRMKLNRVRDRRWDRGWRDLVDNGGGSATFRP
jgi:nitrate reductase NapE component